MNLQLLFESVQLTIFVTNSVNVHYVPPLTLLRVKDKPYNKVQDMGSSLSILTELTFLSQTLSDTRMRNIFCWTTYNRQNFMMPILRNRNGTCIAKLSPGIASADRITLKYEQNLDQT